MERPKERTSNLHRAAGGFAEVLMAELKMNWHDHYTFTADRLKEYLRSAYLRGYEDRVMEEQTHESSKR